MRPETPFSAPWEAQAFALAVGLSDQGVFEWREFSAALGAEIKAAEVQGREDSYYALWLAALEKLLAGKGVVSAVVLDAREAAVREASLVPSHPAPGA
ncbi:nitrile hydratase accessory protein [Rhizobiales bacterium GAS191]|jgi:nitrile hydratase accessory protein|nr:nitrile hydratase accessory protein [Rhizobiales bacterium GAS113]SEB98704.1 nitrile hydratase accessory protein [Rhizobiales bacterium GAS188]SED24356.1 nitrile hydratase accessory protein [Rhizobiales bacterium GAS191]